MPANHGLDPHPQLLNHSNCVIASRRDWVRDLSDPGGVGEAFGARDAKVDAADVVRRHEDHQHGLEPPALQRAHSTDRT